MEIHKYFTKKRILSLLTILVMIVNMFSPFGLLENVSHAARGETEPYYELYLHPVMSIEDEDDWDTDTVYYYYDYAADKPLNEAETPEENTTRVVFVDLILKGNYIQQAAINLHYDSSILKPALEDDNGKSGKNKRTFITEASDIGDFAKIKFDVPATKTFDPANQIITIDGGNFSQMMDGYVTATLMFVLAEGKTINDVTSSAFSVVHSSSIGGGIEINYKENGIGSFKTVNGSNYLSYQGFAGSDEKTVTNMTVSGSLTKNKYYNGETLDYSGISITVTYDDNSSETFDTAEKIAQAISDGVIEISPTNANSTKTATITAGEKTYDLTYSVATSIAYNNNMTKTSYNHDDTIDYTGGSITITYDNDSSNTATLGIQDGLNANVLTSDHATADVNSPTVTLTYVDPNLTTQINLNVRDYITNITVTKNPTKTTYQENDGIVLTGGEMNVTWKSGRVENNLSMEADGVTFTPTQAKIDYCEQPTWKNGELDAGTQKVWVIYGEDVNGDPYKAPLQNITVNDTVASIAVASQPTNAKNKYGMTVAQLNLAAASGTAQLTVTTGAGKTFNINITPTMLDALSYSSTNITTEQNIPVTYGGKTTATGQGVKIKLKNYIKGITITAPSDLKATYDTDYDLSGVTYVKNYADNTVSSAINVKNNSNVTVTGYNKKPAASSFNASHESPQTVKVTLTTVDDTDVDETGKFDTFTVNVMDKVTGIKVAQTLNTRTYDYDGTLSLAGGRISFTYASGATSSATLAMTDSKVKVTELDGSPVNMKPAETAFTNGKCTKPLKVTYTDENNQESSDTTSLSIIIKDVLDTMAIGTAPTTNFNHGDTFSVGSGTAILTYKSGATDTIDLDDGTTIKETVAGTSVKMSPDATAYTNNTLTKNVTVKYSQTTVSSGTIEKSVNYDITLKNNKKSIAMKNSPTKKEYYVGDTMYDLTNTAGTNGNADITVTYQAGNTEVVELTTAYIPALSTLTASGGNNKAVTVTYGKDKDNKDLTTSFTIDVKAKLVDSITIEPGPTKTSYYEGETLDLTGMVVKAHYNDGTSIATSNYTVSPANGAALTPSNTTLTVTYSGTDFSTASAPTATKNLTVTAKAVDNIQITTPPTTTAYVEGQTFNPAGMVIKVNYNYGTPLTISSDYATAGVTFSPSGALATTNNKITVSYGGKTAYQTITVEEKKVDSISVTTPPTKVNYIDGQNLDLTGMVVKVHYTNGTSVATTNYTASPVNGAALTKSDTTVTITYGGTDYSTASAPTTTQSIVITDKKVTGITITTPPSNVTYVEGQKLSLAGMVVKASYNNGTSAAITNYTASPADGATLAKGNTTVTITYNGTDFNTATAPTATQNITVAEKVVSSIQITTPPTTTTFVEGKTFDPTGMKIKVVYNDGTDTTISSDYATAGVTFSPSGALATTNNNVTVSYGGKNANQAITVTQKKVSSIRVKTPPNNVNYVEGQKLNLAGMIIEAVYNNDTSAETTAYSTSLNTGATLSTTDTSVSITYTGTDIVGESAPTVNQAIVVTDKKVTGITITTPPTTVNYVEGQSLDLTGMIVKASYNNGTSGVITNYTASPADGATLAKGNTTVTITYNGTDYNTASAPTATQSIIVSSKAVSSIQITTPSTKTTYVEGETFNPSGMAIKVIYNDGTDTTISSDYATAGVTFSPNGALTLTDNKVTVSYGGQTADQLITVEEKKVDSITVTTEPSNVNYIEGQTLDLSGMVVTVNYNNGTSDTTTDYTVSPANGTKLEKTDTTITITYNGTDITGSTAPSTTQTIVVSEKKVDSIIVTTPPDKVSYIEGQSLDLTGMVVTIHYNNETSATTTNYTTIPLNGTALTATDTNIEITYNGEDYSGENPPSTAQAITIAAKEIANITVTPPTTTSYIEGQSFNPEGMIITINYNDESSTTIESDYESRGVTFNPNNALTLADTTIEVEYRGNKCNQTITVTPDTVTDITINSPSKLTYTYGDEIDLTGATITKVWASGIAHANDTIPITKDMLSNADISDFENINSIGTKQIDVTYEGITKTNAFQITIDDCVYGIEIEDKSKLQTEYTYGDTINIKDKDTGSDLYIIIKYAGGSPDVRETLTSSMVSGFDMNTVQDNQTVTVTYLGKKDKYQINVKDEVTGIKIASKPAKKVYSLGETSIFSDIIINNVMKSGANGSTLASSEYTISALDSSTPGEKTITVTKVGTNFTDTFKVKVIDATTDMYISVLPKQDYLYGEALDISAGKITVKTQTKPDGESTPMTDPSVSVAGYNPNKLGDQTLTVTYTYTELAETGIEQTKIKTDTYTVTVEDYWAGEIEAIAPNKQKYKYGENIDLTGAKVGKVTASGVREPKVDITGEMIKGYDSTKVGTQSIIVMFAERTTTFNVTVVDETLGISINSEPNKIQYTKGQKIDLTGATLNVTKLSGMSIASITPDMISGYNANKTGVQVIKVHYDGFEAEFTVTVKPKPVVSNPITNKPVVNTPIPEEPIPEEPIQEAPLEEPTDVQTPSTPESEKPTATLGAKDKANKTNKQTETAKKVAGGISSFGLLELLILMILKRNANVYVYEAGKFILGGKCRVNVKHPFINIDKYLDVDNYKNKVRIRLNDEISEKLDGKEIEIKHRGNKFKHKVKYNQAEHIITLE